MNQHDPPENEKCPPDGISVRTGGRGLDPHTPKSYLCACRVQDRTNFPDPYPWHVPIRDRQPLAVKLTTDERELDALYQRQRRAAELTGNLQLATRLARMTAILYWRAYHRLEVATR